MGRLAWLDPFKVTLGRAWVKTHLINGLCLGRPNKILSPVQSTVLAH